MENQPLPQKKRSWVRIIFRILFTLSVIINLVLLLAVAGLAVFAVAGGAGGLIERTIIAGPIDSKIAVINIDGIIDVAQDEMVKKQIDSAASDAHVKGLIIRVQSPGGNVCSSDNIHHYIKSYKQQSGQPVVCFMDGLAASGGYYAAVACDSIIASPTTITGSIGVIMGHMDISGLLEDKLGIKPTTIKSGEKKDWPSMFREISKEEKAYLVSKIIEPAYLRFVKLVNEGRGNLSADEVIALADGSIYFAGEAKDKGLIDGVGYFESAVSEVMERACLKDAKVVEYARPFSFSDFIGSQSKSVFNVNKNDVMEMAVPQMMYLWTGKN